MRRLLFRKSLLLILYTLVQLYFMLFNWKLFSLNQDVNLGFGMVRLPPFIILFLLGFIIIVVLSWTNYVLSLKKIIYELENGLENSKMKDKLVMRKVKEQFMKEENVDLLKDKLGIVDLRNRQEELILMMTDLKNDLQMRDQLPSS